MGFSARECLTSFSSPQGAIILYIINLDADWLKTLLKVKLNNSAESLPSQQAEKKKTTQDYILWVYSETLKLVHLAQQENGY